MTEPSRKPKQGESKQKGRYSAEISLRPHLMLSGGEGQASVPSPPSVNTTIPAKRLSATRSCARAANEPATASTADLVEGRYGTPIVLRKQESFPVFVAGCSWLRHRASIHGDRFTLSNHEQRWTAVRNRDCVSHGLLRTRRCHTGLQS